MTPKQKQILEKAAKTTLKHEGILSGGNEHVNPIRKLSKPKKKSTSIFKGF